MQNYAELLDAVGDWLDRDDLTARVPTFLRLAEARLNRLLEDPDMEVTATAAASGAATALPADFSSMISITTGDGALQAMGAADFAGIDQSITGTPRFYTISDGTISLVPANGSANFVMVYRRKVPALTALASTNWLLDRAPDIYLYAVLTQAEAFLAEDDRIGIWKAALDEALAELRTDGARRKWGAGPIAPRIKRT